MRTSKNKPGIEISIGGAIGIAIVVVLVIAFIIGTRNNGTADNSVVPGCHDSISGNEC